MIILRFFFEFLTSDWGVLFFAETSVAQPSYKNKAWITEDKKPKFVLESPF